MPPQTVIHLYGSQSQAVSGSITSYHWTVDQPEENKSNLEPSADVPDPTHELNVAGTYTYCLDVCDAESCSSDPQCNTTVCKKVVVCPCGHGIHCELTWDTPNDLNQLDENGSDMDLHFAHPFATGPDIDEDGQPDPWFDLKYDCFWFNPNPIWESMDPNVSDGPSLDRNDVDGMGPENVYLDMPVDGRTYRIGVHYWDDHGFGASYPTVKCWIAGQEVYEKNLEELGVPMSRCDMWDVATIEWDSGQVASILDPQGGPKITHCYQNPSFAWGGGPCNCDDGDPCTDDKCDPKQGCVHQPIPCPSGIPTCDDDNDGVANGIDNCPCAENPDQVDCDFDGIGDVCDDFVMDPDGDGWGPCGEYPEDNCPFVFNPTQEDMDGDGMGDACDPDI
ncbi:MAG: hypothetical protein GXP54_00370, partial [Deltaproteobacteria bacterium]|nr:hypothetical protein [Deltaproteobacteria bacterium]